MCLSFLAFEIEKGKQRVRCARLWLGSTVPSSQTTILTLFFLFFLILELEPLWAVNSYPCSLHTEHFSLIPITFLKPAFFCIIPGLRNGCPHPVFMVPSLFLEW